MTTLPESATRTFGPRPPAPPPAAPARRIAPRLLRPAAVLGVVLLAALAVSLVAWPTGGRRSAATPRATSVYADVLQGLDAQRAAAFATGEPDSLTRVYAAGSAALAADRRVLTDYVRQGRRVAGLRHELVSVHVLAGTDGHATLHVLDRMPAFRVLDGAGTVVARHAGRGEQGWRVELIRGDAGWRIAALTAL